MLKTADFYHSTYNQLHRIQQIICKHSANEENNE